MKKFGQGDIISYKAGGLHLMFEFLRTDLHSTDYGVTSMVVYPVPGSVVAVREKVHVDKVIEPMEYFPLEECHIAGGWGMAIYGRGNSI